LILLGGLKRRSTGLSFGCLPQAYFHYPYNHGKVKENAFVSYTGIVRGQAFCNRQTEQMALLKFIKESQNEVKIRKIRDEIKIKNFKWLAGEEI
jgi:hypothetical protein